jgi:hypothetical protein
MRYEDLERFFREAFAQGTEGKGDERHAVGRAFDDQPIVRFAEYDHLTGQAMKKLDEAFHLAARGQVEKAIHELKGVMFYAGVRALLWSKKLPAPEPGRLSVEEQTRRWGERAGGKSPAMQMLEDELGFRERRP